MVTTLAQRLRKKSMRLLTRRSDLERKAEREAEREAERAERRERARHMSFFSISFSSCFHFTRLSPRLVVFFCRGKIIRKKEGNNERGSWIFFSLFPRIIVCYYTKGEEIGNRKKRGKGGGEIRRQQLIFRFFSLARLKLHRFIKRHPFPASSPEPPCPSNGNSLPHAVTRRRSRHLRGNEGRKQRLLRSHDGRRIHFSPSTDATGLPPSSASLASLRGRRKQR